MREKPFFRVARTITQGGVGGSTAIAGKCELKSGDEVFDFVGADPCVRPMALEGEYPVGAAREPPRGSIKKGRIKSKTFL